MKNSMKTKKNKSKSSKEVSRILKASKQSCSCDESYIPFVRSFITHLVKEAEEGIEPKAPEDFTPDQNQTDFQGSLEDETPKDNFDTQGVDPNVTANAISEMGKWAAKLEEFTEFINDTQSQSLARTLAAVDRPGSLMRGITRKTSDGITRVAGEVAKLREILNGFINLAPKKQRDADITKMS